MKKLVIFILAIAMIAALSSCSKQKSNTVQVAFVTNNVSDFWKIAEAGVKQGEKDFKCQCEVLMPVQGTSAEQRKLLEDLAVKGVSGVAISPVEPKKIDMLDQAAGQLNLITMDSDAPNSKRLCYVGTSNYDAGKVAGEQLMKSLPNGGKVMVYVGMIDPQNAADRFKGIQDALKAGKSKIQILGVMTDDTDHSKARANVEDTLVKHQDIAGLVGLWSYNGPAIVNAVKAAGKVGKVRIICFDEDKSTLQGVKDGAIDATVVQKPYEFGYNSVRILSALARGDKSVLPKDGVLDTGVEVVNKATVDKFWTTLKQRTGEK